MSIGILGGGAFGTALACVFARGGKNVVQWLRDADNATAMNETRVNAARLPDVTLPDGLRATADLADLAGVDVILSVLPAQMTNAFLAANAGSLPDVPFVCCAKGIDRETGKFQSQIASDYFDPARVAALSGPGFAAEIARGLPTALTIGANEAGLATKLQEMLSVQNLRLYASDDILGVELGGALKNVVSIGCGVAIGAGLGQSARAALLTRGFAEMIKLGLKLGAAPETLGGLAGLGDLTLSATSELSRNYSMGLALGSGTAPDPSKTVEGAFTARVAQSLAAEHGLELPVTAVIAELVDGKLSITQAVEKLLARPLGSEY